MQSYTLGGVERRRYGPLRAINWSLIKKTIALSYIRHHFIILLPWRNNPLVWELHVFVNSPCGLKDRLWLLILMWRPFKLCLNQVFVYSGTLSYCDVRIWISACLQLGGIRSLCRLITIVCDLEFFTSDALMAWYWFLLLSTGGSSVFKPLQICTRLILFPIIYYKATLILAV